MRITAPLGLVLLLGGCATSTSPTPAPPAAASAPADAADAKSDRDSGAEPESTRVGTGRILRPDEIFDILEKSKITYAILEKDGVTAQSLAQVTDQPAPRSRPIDAYTALFSGEPGEPRSIRPHRPPAEIAETFGRAGEAFAAGELESAQRLYAEAAAAEPEYFKSYTYLGNTLHLLGREADAEAALLRALELNPVDYQALLFLGDTYFTMGRFHRAKAVLLRAFMLNRSSDAVRERLEATLAKLDLRLRSGRLQPAFHVVRTSEARVEIRFDEEASLRWMAMAACMACWAYEEACFSRSTEEDDPLRLAMYRECIVNQAAATAVRRDNEGEPIPADEAGLLRAVEGGFLEAVIFWEVVGTVAPLVIYLLPTEAQDDILKYIERFAIESTQLVEGPAPRRSASSIVALHQSR